VAGDSGSDGHTVAGAAGGITAAAVSSKLIASPLYGVRPYDPGNLALTITALALVCAAAAWLPARRASRLAP
jgi:ABC-type antimicrobial peptide transport system permease subunit